MGISDPVTRDTHGSGQGYFKELAKEVDKSIGPVLRVRKMNYFLIVFLKKMEVHIFLKFSG